VMRRNQRVQIRAMRAGRGCETMRLGCLLLWCLGVGTSVLWVLAHLPSLLPEAALVRICEPSSHPLGRTRSHAALSTHIDFVPASALRINILGPRPPRYLTVLKQSSSLSPSPAPTHSTLPMICARSSRCWWTCSSPCPASRVLRVDCSVRVSFWSDLLLFLLVYFCP
jgi:hypothetical protein